MFKTCKSYLNLMFIYKFSILIFVFVLILISLIFNNFLKIYVKCISSYLIKAKITSYYFIYFLYTLCNLLSVLQLSFMLFSYIKILTTFTKFITLILSFNLIHSLIKLTLKKKYKMSNINNFYDMFTYIT